MGIRRLVQLSTGIGATLLLVAAGSSTVTGSSQGKSLEEEMKEKARLVQALRILEQTHSGRDLIIRARTTLNRRSFIKYFEWSDVSRTDAVLTRHFDPDSGEETRSRSITIYLRESQPLHQLVLDLAHELTHAISKPHWDPYDPKLDADSYVWNALEGPGGEIEALFVECQVAVELHSYAETDLERCRRYLSESSLVVSREKIRKDFYRVGDWLPELTKRLDPGRFRLLSSHSPRLFSSTGNSPYPVALLEEYDELTRVACRNTRRRLASLKTPSTEQVRLQGDELLAVRCD